MQSDKMFRGPTSWANRGTSFAVLLPNTPQRTAPTGILDEVQNALKDERKKYAQPVTFFYQRGRMH